MLASGIFAGCQSSSKKAFEGRSIGEPTKVLEFRTGDKITVEFTDVSGGLPPAWEQSVREDGRITLPLNVSVVAAGKDKGQLEREIHASYVPKYFKRLTVNVKPEDRWYWVRGEVKTPTQLKYTGSISVMQAIAAAGDFTDYADKRDIQVTRSTGESFRIDGKDVIQNPSRDVPVYPGDTITVHRRF